MIDPLVSRAIAIGLAWLLLSAAWHKVVDRRRFVSALQEYGLVPDMLLRPATWAFVACEVVLGVTWLAGIGRGATAIVTAFLLTIYAGAIATNLLRGRVHIDCGCGFGGASDSHAPLSWWLVARNLVLAAVALAAGLPITARGLAFYDWLTLALALASAALIFTGATQLLRNRAAIATWNGQRD